MYVRRIQPGGRPRPWPGLNSCMLMCPRRRHQTFTRSRRPAKGEKGNARGDNPHTESYLPITPLQQQKKKTSIVAVIVVHKLSFPSSPHLLRLSVRACLPELHKARVGVCTHTHSPQRGVATSTLLACSTYPSPPLSSRLVIHAWPSGK